MFAHMIACNVLTSRAVCSRLTRFMSTHKFDDPAIQSRFDEKKARREQVIKQEAEDVFDAYLLKLATGRSLPISIADKNLNCKSLDEVDSIIKLLEQKDKRIDVVYDGFLLWDGWIFRERFDKRSW